MIAEYNTLRLALSLPDPVRWIARQVLDDRRSFLLGCARKYDCLQLSRH